MQSGQTQQEMIELMTAARAVSSPISTLDDMDAMTTDLINTSLNLKAAISQQKAITSLEKEKSKN